MDHHLRRQPRSGTNSVDLVAELDAAQRAITAEHRAVLSKCGVSDIMEALGFVGVAHIMLDKSGRTYQPLDDGAEVFLTPVRVGANATTPEDSDFDLVPQFGTLIDLIAWHPRYPGRWATRLGIAAWIGAIEPQIMMPPAVPIRRAPLSWLRGGATGLCILSEDALDTWRVLSVCRALEAEDWAHSLEIRSVLERPFEAPIISVAFSRRRTAS